MYGLSPLDLVILLSYFVAVAAIGWFASRFVRNREDYIMGGRRFGKVMTMMFMFGAATHADNAVGVASQCYKLRSMAGFWYQGMMIFSLPIFWLLAPVYRRARMLTTADFFERRFGTAFSLIYTLFAMFTMVGFTSVGLYGSALLIEALTGGQIPWQVGIPAIAVISFAYGIAGGLVAAVWNDFLQGILTILMSILIIPFFWSRIGGRSGFQNAVAGSEQAFHLVLEQEMTVTWIVVMSVNLLLSISVQPHIIACAGSAKSEMDSRTGFVGGMILKRLMTIPWAITGIMALAMFGPGEIKGDHAFGIMARELLPSGFTGLMLACVLASMMDNVAAAMICIAGLYTNSIHRKLFPQSGERALLAATRWASLGFALLVLPLSYAFTDMPEAMRFMFQAVAPMGVAFFMAILWPRANRHGAMASFIAAYAALFVSKYSLGWVGDAGMPKTVLLYLGMGTLAGVVVSLLTPREDEGRTERFFLLLRTPLGREQTLRDAGLVELPGTGTFEDPVPDGAGVAPSEIAAMSRGIRPSPGAVYGFVAVCGISAGLVGLVNLVTIWLRSG
jgi:Na+/proline symporter